MDVIRRGHREGLVDKKQMALTNPFFTVAVLCLPPHGAATTIMMMALCAPYDVYLQYLVPCTARQIALGFVHHCRATVVDASDNDAEEIPNTNEGVFTDVKE